MEDIRYYNPLEINVPQQSSWLLSRLPNDGLPAHLIGALRVASEGSWDSQTLLQALSHLLAIPACTMLVVEARQSLQSGTEGNANREEKRHPREKDWRRKPNCDRISDLRDRLSHSDN